MKMKQIYTLGVILVILAVAVVLRERKQPQELVSQEYVSLNFSMKSDKISKIEIIKPPVSAEGEESVQSVAEERIELVKEDGEWRVASRWNARADDSKIEAFLKVVTGTTGELRAEDEKLFSDFSIGDEDSYQVRLSSGSSKPELDFHISMEKIDSRYVFVRKHDSSQIFLTESDFYGKLGVYGPPKTSSLNADYWVNTAFIDFDEGAANMLKVERYEGAGTYASANVKRITKEGSDQKQWKFLNSELPFGIDASKIKDYLKAMRAYRAKKALDPSAKDYGFNTPTWKMTVGFEGGETIKYVVGAFDSETESYPMQITGEPVVYELSKYYLEAMDIDDSKFFVQNPLGVDATKLVSLKIESGKVEKIFSPKEKTWPKLTQYIHQLKALEPTPLLFDASEHVGLKNPDHSIEMLLEGKEEPILLNVGGKLSEESNYYAASLEGNNQPFAISVTAYKKLFEDLESLNEPAEENAN